MIISGDDTPLHLAISHNHLDIAQQVSLILHFSLQVKDELFQLIKSKAHVNVSNIHGNTPLHYACFHRYFSLAKYLMENQALLFVANRYGQTPLDLCASSDMSIQLHGLLILLNEFLRIVFF